MTVLDIRNLRVSFPRLYSQVDVIRGCSLEVNKGEIVGLVGESGSGKSITAMSCLGLIPKPGEARGQVKVAEQDIMEMSDRELNHLRGAVVSMIFQNPMTALSPFLTIGRQFVDIIQNSTSVSHSVATRNALQALKSVYIPGPVEALKKYPHQLSGGQLQRIMIAMAISCNPRLLIADEPTTALDVTIQAQILLLIRELARKIELAVLFITHDLSVVASVCDRVTVMYAGEIVESGEVAEVFNQPAHPYTRKLLHTVPEIGLNQQRLEYIPGQVPDMSDLPAGCAFQARCEHAIDICRHTASRVASLSNTHSASCHQLNKQPGNRL